ncbi:hypothetical protein JOC95_001805 [Bacillus tianshenii]|uniref:Uncharacterized protein n=1 Tax=Sutcliffiella tianshenii TaxID=1463404 RepID=A0ABS2NZ47_9BACI|nr:hypothetical protein [Bacillus tianshenii]MBM7619953.1 hypothetical protein [Bacillus tianshenii]
MTIRVKREIFLVSVFSLIVMVIISIWYLTKPDHSGIVGALEESKFTLYPVKVDPEEEPYTPEIHFSEDTKVTGKISSIFDLKDNQEVKVWLETVDGKHFAEKIVVTVVTKE